MTTNRNPQASPAVVLGQLLTEHPELHQLIWGLSPDGGLFGSDMNVHEDARPLMAAFEAVLGGAAHGHWYTAPSDGEERFSSWLPTTWRDVKLNVTLGCSAEFAPQMDAAVAA